MLSIFIQKLMESCVLFKQFCVLCGAHEATDGLCAFCIDLFPRLPSLRCDYCAQPLRVHQARCEKCQGDSTVLDALHVAYLFDYPLDALIHAFKYAKRLDLANALGKLFVAGTGKIPKEFDLVLPVPLAKERLADRGFNQSEELLRYLITDPSSFSRSRPICVRKCNTLPQAALSFVQRQHNVRDVFSVGCRLDGLSIAIVDDVATTLATLLSLAATLKNYGAKRVEAWVLARSVIHST